MANLFSQRAVINFILITAFITIGALGLISYRGINELAEANRWLIHTYQVIETVTKSQLDLKEARVQAENFIHSKNSQQILSAQALIESAEQNIRLAKQLTIDSPLQQQRLKKLAFLVEQKMIRLQELNTYHAIQIVVNQEEQALDSLLDQFYHDATQHERNLLKIRTESVGNYVKKTNLMLITSIFFTEILLFFCLFLLNLNLTKRNHLEEQLELLLSDLKRSNIELERFAYVASHDLQEPLRMVISYTQLIERRYKDKLDADANEFIYYAVDGAKRMQALLENLLLYSRVNRQGTSFELIDFDEIYNDVLVNIKVLLEEKKAIITHDKFPSIMGDRLQLMQLLQNLITNALKFLPKNCKPKVHISTKLDNNEWLFSVEDNGIGIEPKYFDSIFIIFKKLHAQSEYPGTGIGLALCKKIVERHRGRIWLTSEVGKGSIFYFTIPKVK